MCVVLSFVKRERKRENMLCVKHGVVGAHLQERSEEGFTEE